MKPVLPLTCLAVAVGAIGGCDNALQPFDEQSLPNLAPQKAVSVLSDAGIPVKVLGYGEAIDINERGQVVGYSWNDDGDQIAVMWDKGKMIDLGAPAGEALMAVSINERGQIAISVPRFEVGDAYFWEDGELTLIAPDSRVTAVNARGQVVGFPLTDPPNDLAFVWEDGEFTDIHPLPPNTATRAQGLNDAGQVAGLAVWGGPARAFVWKDEVTRPLDTPVYESRAVGINNRGDVVGRITSASGVEHAVVWRRSTLIDLGTLGGADYPLYNSGANDVNDRGLVVGQSEMTATEPRPYPWTRPFLWPGAGGEMTNLGRPQGTEYAGPTVASAINNRGQVVGGGGFTLRAYVWYP